MDGDEINVRNREEKAYYLWLNQEKNRILKITNPQKKQVEWSRLFPKWTPDDSYLGGEVF